MPLVAFTHTGGLLIDIMVGTRASTRKAVTKEELNSPVMKEGQEQEGVEEQEVVGEQEGEVEPCRKCEELKTPPTPGKLEEDMTEAGLPAEN